MMLDVISSSSSGNGCILQNNNEALLIEAGCKISDVKNALDYNVKKVVGAAITHKHLD